MTTVTRTLYATPSSLPAIRAVCKATALVRADLWRGYGALGNVGKGAADIRREVRASGWYAGLAVDGTIRAEPTKDAVNNILTYKAAACAKVRQAIVKWTSDEAGRKRLYTLVKSDKWLEDRYLHRMMRKHFRHGVSGCDNQFIVRSGKHDGAIVCGRLVITITIARQYGEPIRLTTNSRGKGVNLKGCNLRVVLKGDVVEVHYAAEKAAGRPCGSAEVGVDKGYTEAFADSDGGYHGEKFGAVTTAYNDMVAKAGIHISELGHWMRQRRHEFAISGRRKVNVETAWQAISLNASISESEIASHRNRFETTLKVSQTMPFERLISPRL